MDKMRQLLSAFQAGDATIDEVLEATAKRPFEEHLIGKFDHQREVRTGVPEAILAEGKPPAAVTAILRDYLDRDLQLVATRVDAPLLAALGPLRERLFVDEVARIIATKPPAEPVSGRPEVLVLSAGALDQPVAREAALMSELLGNPTAAINDVGVAGLQRLLSQLDRLSGAGVIIVVAGMDGALPSVVAGLVRQPVIAVPTSVGYGASFGGVAALLTMLNSCAPGVAVMNIDNGYGAAVTATKITRLVAGH